MPTTIFEVSKPRSVDSVCLRHGRRQVRFATQPRNCFRVSAIVAAISLITPLSVFAQTLSKQEVAAEILPVIAMLLLDDQPDRDQDGVPDSNDAFPDDPDESRDDDGDGIGDNSDVLIGSSDRISVDANGTVTLSVDELLRNDRSSVSGAQLMIVGVSNPSNGTVEFDSGAQTVTFSPLTGYVGAGAEFYYELSAQGQNVSELVKVNVDINEPFSSQAVSAPNVTQSGGQIQVSWGACRGSDGYRVLFGPEGQRPEQRVTSNLNLSLPVPTQAVKFSVILECYDALGNSVFSPRSVLEVN